MQVCGVTFPRGNYFEHEGEPHCEIHYHASRGTLCNSCQKPVTGEMLLTSLVSPTILLSVSGCCGIDILLYV